MLPLLLLIWPISWLLLFLDDSRIYGLIVLAWVIFLTWWIIGLLSAAAL
jgi:hypothetical protein